MFLKANEETAFYKYFFVYLFIFFFFWHLNLFSLCMQINATIVDAECTPAPTESREPLHSNHTDEDVPEQQMVNSMCQTDPLQVCIKIY
jgi:hypothetical protein